MYQARSLDFLNNRHYDPTTGVFVSVDPLVTTTMQPYIYGGANPVTFSDPSGLCPISGPGSAEACYFYSTGEAYGDVSPEVVTAATDIVHGLAPRDGARPGRAGNDYKGDDGGFTQDEIALLYSARGSFLNPGGSANPIAANGHLTPGSQAQFENYIYGDSWISDRSYGAVKGIGVVIEFGFGVFIGNMVRPTVGPSAGVTAAGRGPLSHLSRQDVKGIGSHLRNIREHRQKLADYLRDPLRYDNQGRLANARTLREAQGIMDGRARVLQRDINKQLGELWKLLRGG